MLLVVGVGGLDGGEAELGAENAADGFEEVGGAAYGVGAAADGQDFEAVVVVEVDMQSGEDEVAGVVLDGGEALLETAGVVVVEEDDGTGGVRAGGDGRGVGGRRAEEFGDEGGAAGGTLVSGQGVDGGDDVGGEG